MNICFLAFLLFCVVFIEVSESAKEFQLSAVTRFQGLPQFYELIKLQARTRKYEIDAHTKHRICGAILINPFFEITHERMLIMTHKPNRKDLQKRYPEIFNELYVESDRRSCFLPSKKVEYTHVNPDTKRVVSVRAESLTESSHYYAESVFVCLSRDTQSNTIKKYFVSSDDYNTNRAINASGINDYITGRFVFTIDDDDKLRVHALAEETGYEFRAGDEDIEKFYLHKRRNRKPNNNPENDPVCSLNDGEKLRLCAIVMGSPHLVSDLYTFVPQDLFVETSCLNKALSFKTQNGLQASSHKEYREWMISCQVKNIENNYQPFFVSQGYTANCAFVYKPVFGFIYLHSFEDNVSVLRD